MRDMIAGIGPITIDPAAQNPHRRQLMRAVMERAEGVPGMRLVQAGYHCRSLSLYARLGFEVPELVLLSGRRHRTSDQGYNVRAASPSDVDACDRLAVRVHGAHRGGELRHAVGQASARVVERGGRITGYSTGIAFFGHAVGETTDDVKALIATADAFHGPGFLVPSRNGELMRWCLGNGLRVMQPMTLMTRGLYSDPAGAWLPLVLYSCRDTKL